jgi:hypothetical protein
MKHRQRLLPSQLVMRVPDDFVEVVSEVASQEAMSTAAFIRCAVMDALKQRGITPAFGRGNPQRAA